MFFRRMFSRKETVSDRPIANGKSYPVSEGILISTPRSTRKFQNNAHQTRQPAGDDKRNNAVLQLTPLWAHIIRTHTLPSNIRPIDMFNEFLERLRDPEWQVRQHALRVLVDVLVVLRSRADLYMSPMINQLVENLGHPAPTVRKGALDCLRVYLSETGMPETILLQILDIGLNQKITNEPFGGRLTCGVMLSLPALVQATLHTKQRNHILRTTIDMLVKKMTQVTHQEITLKVMSKIKELIGNREFSDYMTHGAHREYELLCSVYGVGENPLNLSSSVGGKSWKLMTSFDSEDNYSAKESDAYWRSSDEEKMMDVSSNIVSTVPKKPKEKVIMETEIQINEDTVTMRILEAKDDSDSRKGDNDSSSLEEEIISGNLHGSSLETSGIIQVLSDSEVEEINSRVECSDRFGTPTIVTPGTPRTPKRVTFGGEIIKLRTPDSDTVAQSDVDEIQQRSRKKDTSDNKEQQLSFLTVEIANDNTKPMSMSLITQSPTRSTRPKTATQSPKRSPRVQESQNQSSVSPKTLKSPKSPTLPRVSHHNDDSKKLVSPKSPFKKLNINSVDSIVSPKTVHHEVEVLHNLQRDKSPNRPKRSNSSIDIEQQHQPTQEVRPPPQSWEDLGIVDVGVFKDLRSGDWRHRSHAICSIEEALKSSQNLALVQPCLYSLLRTLLSSERNPEVSEDKRRVVMNLISRLPLDNLEDRTVQIINGLCRQGGPGSNRVSKALMQRLPPAVIVLKLISDDFLQTKSSRFRENALQMVMYALMTFPSTCFDTTTCVTQATMSALDRKKRVRQAALDVLAILGQVISPRTVMDVVQNIANSRDNGSDLFNAVKSRLSRKQLPAISADGTVQYTLRVPTPQGHDASSLAHLGADIEWIASGVGSVSPTSMKRRAHRFQQQQQSQQQQQQQQTQQNSNGISGCRNGCHYNYPDTNRNMDGSRKLRAPHEMLAMSVGAHGVDNNGNVDDIRNNMQFTMGNPQSSLKPATNNVNGEIIGINGKRIATKACSDSSLDRRNSDSTYTSSTSGSDGCSGSGRFVRQTVTSRFPIVDRSADTVLGGFGQIYQNPYNSIAFSQQNLLNLNSTYPKGNLTINHQKKNSKTNNRKLNPPVQEAFHESSTEMGSTFSAACSPYDHISASGHITNGKRFVNVEKFIVHSSKLPTPPDGSSISNPVIQNDHAKFNGFLENRNVNNWQIGDGSTKDLTELFKNDTTKTSSKLDSQTACCSGEGSNRETYHTMPPYDEETTKLTISQKEKGQGEVAATPSEDLTLETANTPEMTENGNNLTPRSLSMTSMKSQVIEEELDGEATVDEPDRVSEPTQEVPDDFSEPDGDEIKDEEIIVTEEIEIDQNIKTIETSVKEDPIEELESITEALEIKSRDRSPTIEEIKSLSRNSSIGKSYESIFSGTPSKLMMDVDSKSSASTETSSDYQLGHRFLNATSQSSNHLIKPQHAPLQRKSKTTLIGKPTKRVSPVKKSIKMGQPELYPQSLTAFERPKEALARSCEHLDSSNWETVMIGLKSMVRLIRYHPDTLDNQMHLVGIQLTKSVRNLRSQVARAACQAATEIFTTKCKNLETESDDLICSLMNRTADTNRFIRADSMRALESMCDNVTPQKVLHMLASRGASHQNSVVRTSTAKLLSRLGDRLGCDKIFAMGRDNRDRFFLTAANLLMEGSLETRSYAKAVFRILSQHSSYNRLLMDVIPTRTYRNIEKSLKSLH